MVQYFTFLVEDMNFYLFFLFLVAYSNADDSTVKDPTLCEVCKYLATELQHRLVETGKSKEIIRTGHGIDENKKKAVDYIRSELRLTEALHEPHICEKILQYNVHAERKGSLRFAKGRSETMETLHGLVNKGVKVDLGIPYEMWDTPSAEVTQLQKQCYRLVERYEDDIEEWYYNSQDTNIIDFLCRDIVLKSKDNKCLYEEKQIEETKDRTSTKEKSNQKGDIGKTKGRSTKQDL